MVGGMSDTNESDDWIAGGTIDANASNLQFFAGSSIPIDSSSLPEPPQDSDVA